MAECFPGLRSAGGSGPAGPSGGQAGSPVREKREKREKREEGLRDSQTSSGAQSPLRWEVSHFRQETTYRGWSQSWEALEFATVPLQAQEHRRASLHHTVPRCPCSVRGERVTRKQTPAPGHRTLAFPDLFCTIKHETSFLPLGSSRSHEGRLLGQKSYYHKPEGRHIC